MSAPVAILAMHADLPARLFDEDASARLAELVTVLPGLMHEREQASTPVQDVELMIAGWGAPRLDESVLERMPQLRGVVYTAGSTKGVMTPEAYARGIRISTAAGVNAGPVAEFTLAAVLLSGKRVFPIAQQYRRSREYRPPASRAARWGNRGLVVGIIGASRIGRRVIELLSPFDVHVLLYDPIAEEIPGVERVALDELLRRSDVVSVHAPENPSTRHMIDRRALALMPDGTTLINTARGSLVDERALVDELNAGRLYAVIDVTDPDPPLPDSPLFEAPGLLLTPHIAGSQGNELFRLGDAAVAEVERFVAGEPFLDDVPEEQVAFIA